jgi:hypothetical protein
MCDKISERVVPDDRDAKRGHPKQDMREEKHKMCSHRRKKSFLYCSRQQAPHQNHMIFRDLPWSRPGFKDETKIFSKILYSSQIISTAVDGKGKT